MKPLGLLILVLCGTLAGNAASGQLKRREALCRCTGLFLDELLIAMRCTCAPLGELLSELSAKECFSSLVYLSKAHELIRRGKPFPQAWREGVSGDKSLQAELKELLLTLTDSLGASDLEGQFVSFQRTEAQLCCIQEKALESYRTKGRLYRCLGVLGGISAALLLC